MHKILSRTVATLTVISLSSLFCSASLSAQVGGSGKPLNQLDGTAETAFFGASVCGSGDANGDGISDYIVGMSGAFPGGVPSPGSAFVYSGADHTLLHSFVGTFDSEGMGLAVTGLNDVDGDGHADFLIGAPSMNSGQAYLYSGFSGTLLNTFSGAATGDSFGTSVADAGDVNADGHTDLIIGAYMADPGGISNAGAAYVYSGIDHSLLYTIDGATNSLYLGDAVSGAGDVDGDDHADFIIGARGFATGGNNAVGMAQVYSGATGTLLHQFEGEGASNKFGSSVSSAGDVNQDGFDDLLIGAPGASPLAVSAAGSAYVYSGASGNLLMRFDGSAAGDKLGESVSGVGDVDGNGVNDLLIGSPQASRYGMPVASGVATVYSGNTGNPIYTYVGLESDGQLGNAVSGLGDVDGDGLDDLITASAASSPGGIFLAGSVHLFGFDPFLYSSTNTVRANKGGLLGLEIAFPAAAALDEYKILMSTAAPGQFHFGVDIPLGMNSGVIDSYFGIYPFAQYSGLHGSLDMNGTATAVIGIPDSLGHLVGNTFWFAAIANKPGFLPEYSSTAVGIKIVP